MTIAQFLNIEMNLSTIQSFRILILLGLKILDGEKKCLHIYMKFMDKDRLLCMQRLQCNLHYL